MSQQTALHCIHRQANTQFYRDRTQQKIMSVIRTHKTQLKLSPIHVTGIQSCVA